MGEILIMVFYVVLLDFNFSTFSAMGLNNVLLFDKWQLFISIASFLVACGTLWMAWKVQKAVASNHAKQKQVEVMSNLVEYLNNTRINLSFIENDPDGKLIIEEIKEPLNIFEIACFDSVYKKNKLVYDEYVICFEENTNCVIDLSVFVNDPFVPQEIANKLMSFHVSELIVYEDKFLPGIFVMICNCKTDNTIDVDNCMIPKFQTVKGKEIQEWKDFKECCYSVSVALKDWFAKAGIQECNIRLDYIKKPSTIIKSE